MQVYQLDRGEKLHVSGTKKNCQIHMADLVIKICQMC